MANQKKSSRPPIVTVMGHIDHGKTTLLDAIRNTAIARGEHGGITQHIGAYQVEANGRPITFIDTPGHAAFEEMRKRGANVADIVILVIAADDGVKPQTVEAIRHIKAAGTVMIVAINKVDVEGANLDRVKQQLAEHEVLVEGYGGDVVAVPISAKTKQGLPELLDMILLVADMQELTANAQNALAGVIIEAKLDRFRGPVATILVQDGTLRVGDTVHAGSVNAKVRALTDDRGGRCTEAGPSTPVELMGWETVPEVGAIVVQGKAPEVSETTAPETPEVWQIPEEGRKEFTLVVKADVRGSLQAILVGLETVDTPDGSVTVVGSGTGEISESDVLLARSTGGAVIGFNVKPLPAAARLAETEHVPIRTYTIIYELLDEARELVQGARTVKEEKIKGKGEIIAVFEGPNRIAGVKLTEGAFRQGENVRVLRDSELIGNATIKSLRQVKQTVQRVMAPAECGILLDPALDFQRGDKLESDAS